MSDRRFLARKVLSASTGDWIRCCWFECGKPGFELYKSVFHEHRRDMGCDHPMSKHINFVFCSERHKQLYLHSHKDMWNLPPGHKTTL